MSAIDLDDRLFDRGAKHIREHIALCETSEERERIMMLYIEHLERVIGGIMKAARTYDIEEQEALSDK